MHRKKYYILISLIIIFIAAFMGDQIGFVLGRLVGRPYLDRHSSPRITRMIQRSERFYEHTGWWAVVAARFFPWLRTFVPPIAGISQMNYYKFLSANALGALLWGAGITLAGYYAATLPWVKSWSYSIAAFFIGPLLLRKNKIDIINKIKMLTQLHGQLAIFCCRNNDRY
jgi:membrane-associated protein